jgi:hypothetical protein
MLMPMSRKFLITAILLLFLLPFVSWYYLQSGLKWRKEAQVIMSGKQPFPEGEWKDEAGRNLSSSQLAEHVTIVTLLSCENRDSMASTLEKFYHQFKETRKANFIVLDTCQTIQAMLVDSLRTDWYYFKCNGSITLCQQLLLNWPSGKTHALIDRNKIIRSYYAEQTKDEKRMLLEHMALLLPRERSDQIILKRGEKE